MFLNNYTIHCKVCLLHTLRSMVIAGLTKFLTKVFYLPQTGVYSTPHDANSYNPFNTERMFVNNICNMYMEFCEHLKSDHRAL